MTNLLRSVFGQLKTFVKPKLTTTRKTHSRYLLTFGAIAGVFSVSCLATLAEQYVENQGGAEVYFMRRVAEYEFRKVDPPNHAWHKDKDIVEVAKATIPAVVRIQTSNDTCTSGTGFFVDAEGLILTNAHVVAGDSKIVTVFTDDRKSFYGDVLGSDAKLDLALVRIRQLRIRLVDRKFPVIKLGDSDGVKKKDFLMTFGFPNGAAEICGKTGSVLGGALLSYLTMKNHRRTYPETQIPSSINSNVSVRPGFSGGPLIDKNGEVVGVNYAMVNTLPSVIALSVPSNEAKKFLDGVKKKEIKQK